MEWMDALILGTDGAIDRLRSDAKALERSTSGLQTQRPRAKMHAVVREDSIAAFAQTRARSFHHCAAIEAFRFMSYSNLSAACETFERNLFHRAAPQSVGKARVMNDTAVSQPRAVLELSAIVWCVALEEKSPPPDHGHESYR